ncbi:MAG: class I SAM-dependent methyltransferase [Pyrinomonadaceae bacterium]
MCDTIERFSNRVENYVKYRPGYPREIISYLATNCGLTHETIITDIGCGTGISSRIFLENCNRVIGVEPNTAMREAALAQLAEFPEFAIVGGTSDNTTLSDGSVDMIVAAQAFHWFDREKAQTEFRRILRPGGHIVLIWNERQLDTTPFLREYEQFLLGFAQDYPVVRHENIESQGIREFLGAGMKKATFQNLQVFDFEGLKGRMLSSSYMPSETDAIFGEMVEELRTIFANHAENGRIKVFYDTNVYHSQV